METRRLASFDLPGAPVDDEVVLDAVALLLAAVELPLPLGILGALDGALHSIDDELESLAFAQHRLEVAGLAGWELLLALWQTLSGVESNEVHSAHLAATGSQVVQQRPQDAGDKLDEAAVALGAPGNSPDQWRHTCCV